MGRWRDWSNGRSGSVLLRSIRGRLAASARYRLTDYAEASAAQGKRVRDALGRLKEQERLTTLATSGAEALANHSRHHARATRKANLLARSNRSVLIGPWCGEVGFELLYWIPFVTWMTERARLDGRRVTVLTRGGAHIWYRHLSGRDVEILDRLTPHEFRAQGRTLKQDVLSSFDRTLIDDAIGGATAAFAKAMAPRLSRPHLVHPLLMYRLFIPYWREEPVVEPISAFTRYRPLVPPQDHPVLRTLPDEFVAVKFYFSHAFPDTAFNRDFVRRVVTDLSEQWPVVVLNSGERLDDHEDALVPEGPRIRIVRTDARDNLATQSAVVSRARAFAGTYGGFSYLAPMYGVNSLSFFSDRGNLVPFHLEHANRVFAALDGGRFIAMDVHDLDVVASALPRHVTAHVTNA